MKRRGKTAVMYIYAVILVSLMVIGFLWFVLYLAVMPIRESILAQMSIYEGNESATVFGYADVFVNNIWLFFLVIFIFGLFMWVIVYAQQKGQPMVVYE